MFKKRKLAAKKRLVENTVEGEGDEEWKDQKVAKYTGLTDDEDGEIMQPNLFNYICASWALSSLIF